MPIPLPSGEHISVNRCTLLNGVGMTAMEMSTDHYNIGYTISGDRITITPSESYCFHSGNVAVAPPYFYHRTIAQTDAPYERILIKFTPDFIQPFIDSVGSYVFEELYKKKVFQFSQEDQSQIYDMFCDMESEYQKSTPYKEFILQGMLFRLLTTIWELHIPTAMIQKNPSPLTNSVLNAICYIETNYHLNPSLEEVARASNLSTGYFSRLFHAQLGVSYTRYLNNVRIRHVKILLTHTNKSIMEIALETGYCNGDYLSAQFKKITGMTPRDFRKSGTFSPNA